MAAAVVAWAWSYLKPVELSTRAVIAFLATDAGLIACEGHPLDAYDAGL